MARDRLTVGNLTVNPGERAYGFLFVAALAAGTEVRIPIHVVHGLEDGPTACLEATLQGWEPMGAEILRRALQRVDPKRLRGTILCVPFANPLAVEFGGSIEGAGQRVNPADQIDLNKVWPGKTSNAWLTERMAAVIWNEVMVRCQYLLDLHDGTASSDELPVAFPHAFPPDPASAVAAAGPADGVGGGVIVGTGMQRGGLSPAQMRTINQKMREMAIAFGSRVIWWREHPLVPTMLSGAAALAGIVPLVAEAGGANTLDATIGEGVECTLNILKHLGMIHGTLVLPKRQIMVSNYSIMRSQTGGFYHAEPGTRLGVEVRKGDLLGRVINPLTSEVTEECRASINGLIISRRVIMPLNPGGYIAHIADTDSIIWERINA